MPLLGTPGAPAFDHIVFHFDGNNNDPDDVAAIPVSALLINAAGLVDRTTFLYGNNLSEPNNPNLQKKLSASAAFAASLDIATRDYQDGITQTTAWLTKLIASGKKVLLIEGGPMEATYRAMDAVNPALHKNVTLLSHSVWNETRAIATWDTDGIAGGPILARTWDDLKSDFPRATYVDIRDQNIGINNGAGFNSYKWAWMNSSSDPLIQAARSRMTAIPEPKGNDPSDAGMLFYALTGQGDGDPIDVKRYLETSPPPTPVRPGFLASLAFTDGGQETIIANLGRDASVSLAELESRPVTVVVRPGSGPVGSVKITIDGVASRIENHAPYVLSGDRQGDYNLGVKLAPGDHDVEVTVFSMADGQGVVLASERCSLNVTGTTGNDNLGGSPNNDRISGAGGNDQLRSGDGDDSLFGDAGNDSLWGGDGTDFLSGGGGNDGLWGGAGADRLDGGAGVDQLYGGVGADTFVLSAGADTLIDFSLAEGDVIDLAALLVGYDPARSDIRDFAKIDYDYDTRSSQVMLDVNGAVGGAAFKTFGTLKSTNITHIGEIVASGALFVAGRQAPVDALRPDQPTGARAEVATFLEFLGVNANLDWEIRSSGDWSRYLNALDYIGIDNLRTQAPALNTPFSVKTHEHFAANGVDFTFIMREALLGSTTNELTQYFNYFASLQRRFPGSVDAIEGLNEVGKPENVASGSDYKSAAVEFQKSLFNIQHKYPVLAGVDNNMFSVFYGREAENYLGYGEQSLYADYANVHNYIGAFIYPYYELINRLEKTAPLTGNLPKVITELGYQSHIERNNPIAVGEVVQAKLTLNTIMDSYLLDVDSIHIFELFDDPETFREMGLFKVDGTPKLAAKALHNLTSILGDDGPLGGDAPSAVEVRGGDAHTHSFVLQKENGGANIIIWREALIWDQVKGVEIAVKPLTVEIDFGEVVGRAEVYDPLVSDRVLRGLNDVDSLSLSLGAHPLIIEVF